MQKRVQWPVFLLTMLIAAIALAEDLDMVLAAPQDPVQGGEAVILDLYLHNNTDGTIIRELPQSSPCRIGTGRTTVTVSAFLVDPGDATPVSVPGRGFVKRRYSVTLPIYATGTVHLVLEKIGARPLTFPSGTAPSEAWVGQQVPLDEGATLAQSFLDDLSVHEPMYFLLGLDPGLDQSKFQLSFKYRLFNADGYLAEQAPWVSGFHLAYTQRSIWDLKNDSKPFDDTSYIPELFYLLPNIDLNVKRISAFGIQSGFQHESNGKGGDESRSTNYIFLKPILGVHLAGPFHLKIAPKLFTYVNNSDSTNEDLMDYRGYFDLEVGLLDPEGLALDSHVWWAKEGASVQLDLTYPMTRLFGKDLNFYLQAQYFSGFSETLRHYSERRDALRIGFSIVR